MIRVLLACALAALSVSASEVEGISQPSADVALSFVRPGRITGVNVTEGQIIKKGDLLAQLDTQLEQSKIEQFKAELGNDVKKRAEKAKILQKKKDLEFLKKAVKEGAGTQKEVDTAILEIVQMEFTIEALEFDKTLIKKKIKEQEILLEQAKLKSPIDGLIESVIIERGESVERLKEVIRIVKVNPLWVDVNIPLDKCGNLKIGNDLMVKFPKFGKYAEALKKGKIIFRSALADPGSETLKFRIQVDNPDNRLAGERVQVQLPGK